MEKPSFTFTMPLSVQVVEMKGEEKVFLDGLLSTNDMDLVHDVVTKNCLESMKDQILERNIKLDVEHEAFRGRTPEEKEINKTKIPKGRLIDATVENLGSGRWGLRIKSMLNKFCPSYDQVKGNVIEKMLDAYSIAFIATKHRDELVNGKSVRLLDDVSLLNVALTGNPVNTEARNREIFMKSIESIEDYQEEKKSNPEVEKLLEVKSQSHSHESDELNTKEVKKMEKEETTTSETSSVDKKAEGVNGGTYGKEGGNAPGKGTSKEETTSSTMEETKALLEEMKARQDVLEAEVKALKAMPVNKSPMVTPKGALEQKSAKSEAVGPLDYI